MKIRDRLKVVLENDMAVPGFFEIVILLAIACFVIGVPVAIILAVVMMSKKK